MIFLKRFYFLLMVSAAIVSCGDDDDTTPPVEVEAGTISGGPFSFTIDGVADMVSGITTDGTGVGTGSSWIITDDKNEILGTPKTIEALEAVNFESAGAGICFIWYIRYEGELTGLTVGQNTSGLQGNFDLSNTITVTRTNIGIDGGMVSLADGSTSISGVAGTGQLTLSGVKTTSTAADASYWYIITDDQDDILDWVNPDDRNNATLDLSGAPAGVCHIWGWSYKGLDDPIKGENISTLDDDELEQISTNWITVTRVTPDGGMVSLADGATDLVGVAGTDQLIISGLKTSSTANGISYWYIITDKDDNILDWVNPSDRNNAMADLSGAPAGECHIWGWSYKGLDNPIKGENIATLDDDDEEDISENWVTVIREAPDGGKVSLADGSTTLRGNAGSSDLIINEMKTSSSANNLSYWYIITDKDDNILDWVNPSDRNNAMADLSGAPAGECHIWGWSYKGLDDPIKGENISTLDDDAKEDISENWITVIRTDV